MSRQKRSMSIFNTQRGPVGIAGNYPTATWWRPGSQKKKSLTHAVWWFCVANPFNCFRMVPRGAIDKYRGGEDKARRTIEFSARSFVFGRNGTDARTFPSLSCFLGQVGIYLLWENVEASAIRLVINYRINNNDSNETLVWYLIHNCNCSNLVFFLF